MSFIVVTNQSDLNTYLALKSSAIQVDFGTSAVPALIDSINIDWTLRLKRSAAYVVSITNCQVSGVAISDETSWGPSTDDHEIVYNETLPGERGATGIQGATGFGIQGATGVAGVAGPTGTQGLQGITGAGIQGETGVQGVQGLTGAPYGPQGETGARGVPGLQGIQGDTGYGVQGDTGLQGPTGVRGPTGAGIQGATGIGNVGAQGSTGLQGPRGETGVQGTQGMTGVQGTQGDRGNTGIQGFTGPAGAPQGVTGVQGATGAGVAGATGIQGVTGIRGTTGIQGEQGETGVAPDNQGTTGVAGIQGATGVQGIGGDQGVTGVRGVTGVAGNQGATGVQGNQGITGLLGITGLSGDQGVTGISGLGITLDEAATNGYLVSRGGDTGVGIITTSTVLPSLWVNKFTIESALAAIPFQLIKSDTGSNNVATITNQGSGITLDLNKTHTGSGNVIDINNAGTGDSIYIQSGTNSKQIDIYKFSGTGDCLYIDNSGTGRAINITQNGAAEGIYINSNATTHYAATIISDRYGLTLQAGAGAVNGGYGIRVVAANADFGLGCLTIDKSHTGSGNIININNSGSGNDIVGTGSTWSVTKAGAATFSSVNISGTNGPASCIGPFYEEGIAPNAITILILHEVGGGYIREFVAPGAGKIVGVSGYLSHAPTAGGITLEAYKNNITSGVSDYKTSGNSLYAMGGNYSFAAGDILTLKIVTVGYAPVVSSTQIAAWILVRFD